MGLVAALALGGSPAGAGTERGPEILDPTGDANAVNGQGFFLGFPSVSAPGNLEGADLEAIWLETVSDQVKEKDEAGSVKAVKHVAKALRITFQTAASPTSVGTALQFQLPATVAGCTLIFRGYVAGPTATVPSSADITKSSAATCPGGSGTVASPAFSLKIVGNRTVLEYPFSALPYSSTQIVLAPDVEIRPRALPANVRILWGGIGVTAFAPQIDETAPLAAKFRIGKDLPANIDCVANPTHALCAA